MDFSTIMTYFFGGTSIFSIIMGFLFYKQKKKLEHLNVKDKDIDVAVKAVANYNMLNEQIEKAYEKIKKLGEKLDESTEVIVSQNHKIIVMENRIEILIEIAERQIELKEYAESHLCTVVECKLREPPMGTYRSSSDKGVLKDLLVQLRKKEEE